MYAFDYIARGLASKAKASATSAATAATAAKSAAATNTTAIAALPTWHHNIFTHNNDEDDENFDVKPTEFDGRLYLRLAAYDGGAKVYLVHNALPENLFADTPSGTDCPATSDLNIAMWLDLGRPAGTTTTSQYGLYNVYTLDYDDSSSTQLYTTGMSITDSTWHGRMLVHSGAGRLGTPAADKYCWLYEFIIAMVVDATTYDTYMSDYRITQLGTESLV